MTSPDFSTVTDWETVVGLEVHVELKTRTKMWCSCPNEFGSEPNTNICPVCLGLPGSLPVCNRYAVELAMRVGTALHCTVEPSIFHRKNYFYPDMPKDYQISQFDRPINVDGWLTLPDGFKVGIERAHLEEDTGKSTHMGDTGRIHDATHSLVDYNRAGVPLLEIVGRPDIRTPEQARQYVAELRAIVMATGASDGKLEEGSMRVDANVSVRPVGESEYGTRCEIKNINSLRSLGRAIDYEASRQVDLLRSGDRIVQETRHWNEDSGRTSSMRSKEEANDYRYFPEPDLVPVEPSAEWIAAVRSAMPKLPAQRRATLAELTGMEVDHQSVISAVDRDLDGYVEGVAARCDGDVKKAARVAINRAVNDIPLETSQPVDVGNFCELVAMEVGGKLTATQAKKVLEEMSAKGGHPHDIAKANGFEALDDDELARAVDQLIADKPKDWEDYVGGNDKVAGMFVGLIMKSTKGKANGKEVTKLLQKRRSAPGL